MAEFKNYKEVAFLLSKAVQGQLTEKEEEMLGKWRQEFPENELLYRRVLTSEFIISKSKQWEQVDLVMAYLKVRQKCEHTTLQKQKGGKRKLLKVKINALTVG